MKKNKKSYTKKNIENAPILNDEQKQSNEPYGTQWPNTIGQKRHPQNDGKIRDVWGNVMG